MGRLGAVSLPLSDRKPERGPRPPRRGSRRLLDMRVDATDYVEAVDLVLAMAESGGGTTCAATVHMVMEAWDDPGYRRVVNDADLVTSDGVPLVWSLRLLGIPDATRVYGPELMPRVCDEASRRGIPVGLFGGTPRVMGTLVERLATDHPGLQVVFAESPPMGLDPTVVDETVAEAIEDSGARIVFVGLGCPKQERWMATYRDSLPCALVGVGAAFDFLAGEKRQAPLWIQRAGLEWVFRLACEPRRLWRRYAHNNPRFVWQMFRQVTRERGRSFSA